MKCRKAIAAIASAAALGLAASAGADSRLVSHPYDPDEVVRVDGKVGVQATIGFAADESIENVAVGDSEKWQITPNKRANLLFVKPLTANARTNMTVVTDQRTYFFDLIASANAKPVYMLRFTYGEGANALAAGSATTSEFAEAFDSAELAVVDETGREAAAAAGPAVLNFAWRRNGESVLMPERIYDDGKVTYLTWRADAAVPAILVRNEAGEEGPAAYAVRGRTIVMNDVPPLIVLRSGEVAATLENMVAVAAGTAAAEPAPAQSSASESGLAEAVAGPSEQ